MPSESPTSAQSPQDRATELFLQGHAIEATGCRSEAIRHGESADLWNDWAVAQLSLAEQAFRRALELGPFNADASTNLGFLLFTMGRYEEAADLLKKSLAWSTGTALAQIQSLLRWCSAQGCSGSTEVSPRPNKLDCTCGKTFLLQRGQKVGRPRGSQFHRAWRCKSCGFIFFDSPKLEFLADYYKGKYPSAAGSWYNAQTTTIRHAATLAPETFSTTLKNTATQLAPSFTMRLFLRRRRRQSSIFGISGYWNGSEFHRAGRRFKAWQQIDFRGIRVRLHQPPRCPIPRNLSLSRSKTHALAHRLP